MSDNTGLRDELGVSVSYYCKHLNITKFCRQCEMSRTLVRVVDMDPKGFHVIIPGWNVREKVRIDYDNFPDDMRHLVKIGKRFHALANVGAESHEDLRLGLWEFE